MRIAIIGASGFVGSKLLKEALDRGHKVIAIVRHPEKITIQHPDLVKKGMDVFQTEELSSALKGYDAVLSAYNAGWANDNYVFDFITAAKSIQEAVKKAGIKRLLVVGGAGSLEISPGVQLVDSPQFPAAYKSASMAVRDYYEMLKQEKELDWTFVSPAINILPDQPGRTGKFRLDTDHPVLDENFESRISVEDLAVAILDELENNQFIKKRFTMGY